MVKYEFIEKKDNSYIFVGDYMEIYIDKENFTNELAEFDGNEISTIGFFCFEVFTKEQYDNNKSGILFNLSLPVRINFEYSSEFVIEKKLKFDKEPKKYNVFRLTYGDKFVSDINIEEGMGTAKLFIDTLHSGKIPSNVKYSDIYKLYLDTLSLTGAKIDVEKALLEIMVSELCRYDRDEKYPFRLYANATKSYNDYAYSNIRLQRLPNLNSEFTGIAFERMNESLLAAVKMEKDGTEQKISPIEKTIKY